jgi:hypothetical protein
VIEDLLSYRLSDLLLFSPRSYLRQFELYNHWLYPAQWIGCAYGVLLPWLLRFRGQLILRIWIGLAGGFTMVCCYGFLWQFYAQINWMIEYLILIWLIQAGLLLWMALVSCSRQDTDWSNPFCWLGITLWLSSLLLQPLVEWMNGRSLEQLSAFALTPDSLGFMVLGYVLMFHLPLYLAFPAILWLIFSGLTYLAMENPMGLLPAFAVSVFLVALFARRPLRSIS